MFSTCQLARISGNQNYVTESDKNLSPADIKAAICMKSVMTVLKGLIADCVVAGVIVAKISSRAGAGYLLFAITVATIGTIWVLKKIKDASQKNPDLKLIQEEKKTEKTTIGQNIAIVLDGKIGFIGNPSKDNHYIRKLNDFTLLDGSPIKLDPNDFFIPVKIYSDEFYFPGYLFDGKKSGEKVQLKYKDDLIELTIDFTHSKFAEYKGDRSLEEWLKDVKTNLNEKKKNAPLDKAQGGLFDLINFKNGTVKTANSIHSSLNLLLIDQFLDQETSITCYNQLGEPSTKTDIEEFKKSLINPEKAWEGMNETDLSNVNEPKVRLYVAMTRIALEDISLLINSKGILIYGKTKLPQQGYLIYGNTNEYRENYHLFSWKELDSDTEDLKISLTKAKAIHKAGYFIIEQTLPSKVHL